MSALFFPNINPSSRTFTPGVFPQGMLRTLGGLQSQVRHSNAITGGRLILSFSAVDGSTVALIRSHYLSTAGLFSDFSLPADVWIGTVDPTPTGYAWRYASRPSIVDVGCGLHNITVELVLEPATPEPPPPPEPELNQVVAYVDGNAVLFTGDYDEENSGFNQNLVFAGAFKQDGGPFNEPYIEFTTTITNSYGLELGDNSPGVQDYTVEAWYRASGAQNVPGVFLVAAANFDITIGVVVVRAQSTVNRQTFVTSVNRYTEFSGPSSLSEWQHVAIVREGNAFRSYANGVLMDTEVFDQGAHDFEPYNMSEMSITGRARLDLGQLRYTKGVALYSGATITVPTEPFFVP